MFGKTQMNIHYLETLTFEVHSGISFHSQQHKLSLYVFIGLYCLLPEAAIRVEKGGSVKKGVLKNVVNIIGKHLYWRLFLIKLQA